MPEHRLPIPSYIVDLPDTAGSGNIRWIGFAQERESGLVTFLWAANLRANLDSSRDRTDLAESAAAFRICRGADSAIGPAVMLRESDPTRGVVIDTNEGSLGVYIEARHRLALQVGPRVESPEVLRRTNGERFAEEFRRALAFLP